DKRNLPVIEEKLQTNESDIDSITTALEALTINRVKQETDNGTKIDKIESDIKELVKVIRELTNNTEPGRFVPRNQNPTRNLRPPRLN
ncbi:9623_t:CDS:1, partial [Racocetra fulgida]